MKQTLHEITPRRGDLGVIAAGQAVSFLGDEIALVGLTLHAYAAGWGPAGVSALFAAAALGLVLASPPAGRLVDRFDSRLTTVGAAAWQGLCVLALTGATGTAGGGRGERVAILVLVAALNAGQALAGPAWQALLPEVAPAAGVERAVSVVRSAQSLAAVAGPAVGGLLVGGVGLTGALIVDAASFGVLLVAALVVRARRRPAAPAEAVESAATDGGRAGRSGWVAVRADPLLWPLVVGLLVLVLTLQVVNVADVFLVRGTLHAGPAAYGTLAAVIAAAMVGGSLVGGRLHGGATQARWVLRSAAAIAATLVLCGVAPGLIWLALAGAGLGVANGVLNVAFASVVLQRARADERGRVLATVGAVVQSGTFGGMILGGVLTSLLPPRAVFVASGVAGMAVSVLVARAVRPWRAARPGCGGERMAA